ncbi:hypothetical protein [Sinorhizobium meliloti]|uniref:tetratricopeptide repeat protein n=1 Tax=Rhizobium meliloti TaxID=382 RepID=UPI000FD365E8|nr:hypothetical protein [Sinorhizobium meliloti]RVN82044.1 hypothetical protein CN101_30260 [Sinorhizobium meliloti]RVP02825.1 hypothetical protein CN109_32885 [Sinorhizobium meliloti]
MASFAFLAAPLALMTWPRPIVDGTHAKLEYAEGSRDLLVIFSSRSTQKFQYAGTFADAKINKLFMVDRTGLSWYQEGVPGFADDLVGIAQRIRELKRLNRFKTVTCFGASMGGYAAIMVGALAKVDRVVSVSPQVVFHRGWDLTPPQSTPLAEISTSKLVREAKKTRFEILTSSELLDVYHASLLSELPNVKVAVAQSGHNVLKDWKINGILGPSVNSIVIGGEPVSNYSDVRIKTLAIKDRLKACLAAYYRRDFAASADLGRQILKFCPDWFDANAMVGVSYFNLKRFSLAIPYLSRAHTIYSLNRSIYPALIVSHIKQDSPARAQELVAEYTGLLEADGEDVAGALSKLAGVAFSSSAHEFSIRLRNTLRTDHGRNTVMDVYLTGRSLTAMDREEAAKECFEQVLARAAELKPKERWVVDKARERLSQVGALLTFLLVAAEEWLAPAWALL